VQPLGLVAAGSSRRPRRGRAPHGGATPVTRTRPQPDEATASARRPGAVAVRPLRSCHPRLARRSLSAAKAKGAAGGTPAIVAPLRRLLNSIATAALLLSTAGGRRNSIARSRNAWRSIEVWGAEGGAALSPCARVCVAGRIATRASSRWTMRYSNTRPSGPHGEGRTGRAGPGADRFDRALVWC
jgi:hypothetical protein